MIGEIEAREVTVLVEFLECAIFENVASIPDSASFLVSAPVGDVLGPLFPSGIVFVKVLVWYASEEVVVNPT